jgi:hypothetical protein
MCPVCGYPDLFDPAYDGDLGSLEICFSCGYQFGYDDDDQHITHEQWRRKWIAEGMPWYGVAIKPPPGWDPHKQLLNVLSG